MFVKYNGWPLRTVLCRHRIADRTEQGRVDIIVRCTIIRVKWGMHIEVYRSKKNKTTVKIRLYDFNFKQEHLCALNNK